jgi:hypothetical protein
MNVTYFGGSQTPQRKAVMAIDLVTTAIIWTPATDKKVVITDLAITPAATGTIQIRAHQGSDITYASTVLFEHMCIGSATVTHRFVTPLVNPYNNGVMSAVSGANGSWVYANLGGFEI